MIKEQSTSLREAKVRCDTCAKELYLVRDTFITQLVIDIVNFKAGQHERQYPKHNIEVMVWEKAPESLDIMEQIKQG